MTIPFTQLYLCQLITICNNSLYTFQVCQCCNYDNASCKITNETNGLIMMPVHTSKWHAVLPFCRGSINSVMWWGSPRAGSRPGNSPSHDNPINTSNRLHQMHGIRVVSCMALNPIRLRDKIASFCSYIFYINSILPGLLLLDKPSLSDSVLRVTTRSKALANTPIRHAQIISANPCYSRR